MDQYIVFANHVIRHGKPKPDRTGTGTISYFGYQMRFDLTTGFPLLTTKKIHWKSVVHELLWFIKGDTNIRYLVQNGVRIWNEWPYQKFVKSSEYNDETLNEFVQRILLDEEFAFRHGDLGPVYGHQWRNFNGVDQLKVLLQNLKNDPFSRRHIVSAWNPPDIPAMALPPCHTLMQFYVDKDYRLSCKMTQRSADIFLGVPFNIASYALLTRLIAHCLGYKPGEFIHDLGDCHIYNNHREQLAIQLGRRPKTLPMVQLNPEVRDLFAFQYEDIRLQNYYSWPAIRAEVSV